MTVTHIGSLETSPFAGELTFDISGIAWEPGDVAVIYAGAIRNFIDPAGATSVLDMSPGGFTRFRAWTLPLTGESSGSITVDLDDSSDRWLTGGLSIYRGVNPADPVNAVAPTSEATATAPSVTTDEDGCRVIRVYFSVGSESAFELHESLDERINEYNVTTNHVDLAVGDVELTAAGATGTLAAVVSSPTDHRAATIALNPADPPVTYSLTTDTEGDGTVELDPPGGTYEADTEVDAYAIPDVGATYGTPLWTGPDVPSGQENANPLTVVMDDDKSITANFVEADPLDTPVPVVDSQSNPTTAEGTDGSATVSWPAVSSPEGYSTVYDVELDSGSGWTLVANGQEATTREFTGLTAGGFTAGVTARPVVDES